MGQGCRGLRIQGILSFTGISAQRLRVKGVQGFDCSGIQGLEDSGDQGSGVKGEGDSGLVDEYLS